MKYVRSLNNNAAVVIDDMGRDAVIFGRGISFSLKKGDEVTSEIVERIFLEKDGDGFETQVKEGDTVRKGQCLLTMDLNKIQEAGYPATVITVVTNSNDFSSVEVTANGLVDPEMDMICIRQ